MRLSIGNCSQVGQIYPFYYEKMFCDGLKAFGETEIVSLSRSAWFGSQRFGTLLWSGDIPSSFDSMRRQVKAGLNLSLCGIPWWTTDIEWAAAKGRCICLRANGRILTAVRRTMGQRHCNTARRLTGWWCLNGMPKAPAAAARKRHRILKVG